MKAKLFCRVWVLGVLRLFFKNHSFYAPWPPGSAVRNNPTCCQQLYICKKLPFSSTPLQKWGLDSGRGSGANNNSLFKGGKKECRGGKEREQSHSCCQHWCRCSIVAVQVRPPGLQLKQYLMHSWYQYMLILEKANSTYHTGGMHLAGSYCSAPLHAPTRQAKR